MGCATVKNECEIFNIYPLLIRAKKQFCYSCIWVQGQVCTPVWLGSAASILPAWCKGQAWTWLPLSCLPPHKAWNSLTGEPADFLQARVQVIPARGQGGWQGSCNPKPGLVPKLPRCFQDAHFLLSTPAHENGWMYKFLFLSVVFFMTKLKAILFICEFLHISAKQFLKITFPHRFG